ncbi:SGNH/GDSL hydrolase family protein [Neolewinella aurantiaca]|uniref:SGNH/GDSL hydrolase family protein n=1 Tax=Neolewinella aurantiaca TaxID=2602767 RepID=A0A5C7FG92_9BACT|nr:SGNH/GDSL hydrolase family protein [Neolewinella aurantiaca]TXF89967.1 SGNH/GDSL hydrolase family protein [Neolewinella aurantiaca]
MQHTQTFLRLLSGIFLLALPYTLAAQVPANDTLLIDFGNNLSPAPWNNVTDPAVPDTITLANSAGFTTTYGLSVSDPFNNINTGGTQTPDEGLGFPATATGDSFFGSVTDFGGQIQPTGGVTLVGLIPEKDYTITLFASREATDNREAQYVVSGSTTETLLLDAASNTSVTVSTTVRPDADGSITVTAGPGPNNTNSAGFYYLGAMKVIYEHEEVALPQDTILVDFGSVISPAPWNNMSDQVTGNIRNLANTAGFASSYDIVVVDRFNGINTGGTQTPDEELGYPASVTGDSFFGSVTEFSGLTEPTGGFHLRELRPEKSYTITLFASRDAADNREAQYVLAGASADTLLLNASDNTGMTVTTTLFPAADSTITITAATGPNNDNGSGFYYLGALSINYDAEERPPVVDNGGDTLLIDFGDILSPTPWNNVTDPASDTTIQLLLADGSLSAISLTVIDSFNSINRNGTVSPSSALGLPATATGDSFFGNVTPFTGQTQPTGGVELANMNPETPYFFSLFASRSASDNREAQYIVQGMNTDTVYLDAASNDDSAATIIAYPGEDGTVRITAGPGPNNDNSSGFYYLGAIKVGFESEPAVSPFDTVLVDFGGTTVSPAPWNNVTDPVAGIIGDLSNTSGFQTGYGLEMTDAFNNINTDGTINPAAELGFPATATGDSFFGNSVDFGGQVQPTAAVTLTNLTVDKAYTLDIFASRTTSENRETQYVVEGLTTDTVYLNVASNSDMLATTTMLPATDGTIVVTATAGPNNVNSFSFYYLGALRLVYENEAPAGGTSLALLAPNGGEFLQAGKTTDIRWESRNLFSVDLEYSADAGANWSPIETVPAIGQSYNWTIPATATTEGLIRITADTLTDTSDDVFEISLDSTSCNIVVLGSSTAEGAGASSPDSSWVNRFSQYLAGDSRYEVTNLGRGGYTTYHILPTGTSIPAGVNISVDQTRNITRALELDPFAIIINMPSNDAANNFSVADQLANFRQIVEAAASQGVRVWVATTQPRNFSNPAQVDLQREVRDSIFSIYGEYAIDFWNDLATDEGFIDPDLDSGDGVHVNNTGHRLIFERVRDLRIDTLNCSLTTALSEPGRALQDAGARIFPNPTGGEFQVQVSTETSADMTVSLVDALGREHFQRRHFLPAGQDQVVGINPELKIPGARQMFCVVTLKSSDGLRRSIIPLTFR